MIFIYPYVEYKPNLTNLIMNKNFKTEENIDIDSFNSYNINACQINSNMRDNRKRKDSYSTLDLNE